MNSTTTSRRSKYPAFERVTTGKLVAGDRILIRERQSDHRLEHDPITGEYIVIGERVDGTGNTRPVHQQIPAGVYTVGSIESKFYVLTYSSRRQRYYVLGLVDEAGTERHTNGTPPERWNRVTEAGQ